jgi:hypothetical protein
MTFWKSKPQSIFELTQPVPRPEPELALARSYPRRGSPEWAARYRLAIEFLESAHDASPSTDDRVTMAFVELFAAMNVELHAVKQAMTDG